MKKILAAILALTMATTVLASCGSEDNSSSTAETTSSATESKADDTASKTESKADDAVSKSEDGKEEKPKPIEEIATTLENQDKASITFNKNMKLEEIVEPLAANDYKDDESKIKMSVEELAGIPMLRVQVLDKNRKGLPKVAKFHLMMNKLFEGHEDLLPNIFSVDVELVSKAVTKVKDDDGNEKLAPSYFAGKIIAQPYDEEEKSQKWEELEEYEGNEWVSEWSYKKVTGMPGVKASSSFKNTKEPQYFAFMQWRAHASDVDLYIANITFYDKDGNVIPCEYGK